MLDESGYTPGAKTADTLSQLGFEVEVVVLFSSGIGRDALHRELGEENNCELHLIGDAFAPRHLRHAMLDGARTDRSL